ncbi:hypothetical protein GCM10010124_39040 [Pilimelia terevasa]|uniref:Zinc metalloprotease n=1 Tax=Pilimelia terevasa TaxID=53372 RepID=A0A8J3BS01_9ACTN|nr:site-2 protease family protein [Pilimelia terevasa]GGK42367.1 hypothetical protein GCM10010124_39040 [Pilimelia terevasa]
MTAIPAPPPPGARRPGIPLGRLAGAPVHLQPSALLFAGLVALAYRPVVAAGHTTAAAYLIALVFVVLLFASVLLHELGHALVARRYGIGVRGITLELLGGYTELDRPAPRPGVDLAVAAAGPLVSLTLGGAGAALAAAVPGDGIVNTLLTQLAVSNLVVGLFNSLPGLPLDGGRVLAAAVWRFTGDRGRGVVAAGWVGRGVALVTAVTALLLFQLGFQSLFGLAFALLLVVTLWQGAGAAVRAVRGARAAAPGLAALAAPLAGVPAGTPLARAQDQLAASPRPDAVLAVLDPQDRVVAVVDDAAAAAVPPAHRGEVDVATVARALSTVPALPVTAAVADLREILESNPAALYLVTSGEDVCGVLRAAVLTDWLESQRK